MTVGGQLQTLFFRPSGDPREASHEPGAPRLRAKAVGTAMGGRWWRRYETIENPHVNVMKELRKELNGQCGVNAASSKQAHGGGQGLQHGSRDYVG